MAGGRATRSDKIDSGTVQALVGLSDDEITTLRDTYSIQNVEDLALLDKEDIDSILGADTATFMKRRKLTAVSKFIQMGGLITPTTSMKDVTSGIATRGSASPSAPAPAPVPTSTTLNSAPIKLSPNDFPKFTGELDEQEMFKSKAEAQIGQTAFKFLLTRDAVTPDEMERDEELFNVFKTSFLEGKAFHLISRSLTDVDGTSLPPSGRRVWQQFLLWCNSGGRKNTVLKNIKRELKDLKLDGDTVDGFDYVNKFIIGHQKLLEIGAEAKESEMLVNFVENITDPDFDTVRQILENYNMEIDRGNRTLNAKELFDMVENRQRTLNVTADVDMEVKSRRQVRGANQTPPPTASALKKDLNKVYNLPKPLWNSLSSQQQSAFIAHKKAQLRGDNIPNDKIKEILAGTENSGGKGGKNKRKKVGAIKLRRTVPQPNEPSPEDVHILMKSDDDCNGSDDSDADEPPLTEPARKGIKTNKVIRKSLSTLVCNDESAFPYATILDSGTEWSVVGGPAWSIIKKFKHSLNMAAVDADMNSVPMQLCDAVTALLDDEGHINLFGVRRCGFSPTLTDGEAVINNHFLREAGWKADCVAERHGGTQSIFPADGKVWPLQYDANKYKMYLKCRCPTAIELSQIKIKWVDCHMEDLAIEKGIRPIRRQPITNKGPTVIVPGGADPIAPELFPTNGAGDSTSDDPLLLVQDKVPRMPNTRRSSSDDEPLVDDSVDDNIAPMVTSTHDEPLYHQSDDDIIDWQKTLGDLTDIVAAKTIANTTQFYPHRIESENRMYPQQHRQKRLHALHYKRIPGRTCGDTFFSSIKSIRGYTCVQLFVAVTWDFLWIKVLRRESQVPGAYLDFCKEVGAPNTLLTDNSKVQSGRKFQEVNRKNKTDHTFTTPHCQNQNLAERKIQDVKHKAIMHLYSSDAPLSFWCYAVKYVVDCLNHTAKQSLNWQVPQTLLSSNTVDISVFRFYFWQPIEFLSPKIKFPGCKWQKGRFVGIAWNHGDPFTYRIWTEPDDGGWKAGEELVRNVVRPRKVQLIDQSSREFAQSSYDDLDFSKDASFVNTAHKTKRKRGRTSPGPSILREPSTKRRRQHLKQNVTVGNSGKDTRSHFVTFDDTHATLDDDSDNNVGVNQFTSSSDPHSCLQNSTVLDEEIGDDASITADGTDLEEPVELSPDTSEQIDDTCAINDDLNPTDKVTSVGGASLVEITGYRWNSGRLQLRFLMSTDESQWIDFRDAKIDFPRQTATYISEQYKPRSSRNGSDRVLSWANRTMRNIRRATRRIVRLYDFFLDDDDNIRKVRRAVRAKKKKAGLAPRGKVFKFGIQVPRTIKEAYELDAANGNTYWQDAIKLEMDALENFDAFEFHPKGYHPGSDYQSTRLRMIFDVKADTLRRKARLVAGGHLLDVVGIDVYSSTVKSISVKLLHVIAHSAKLEALCGDIGNAYEQREKVFCIAGPEFGDRQGMTVVIKKALYGLASSGARFHDHLADTFRNMGFSMTRFDRDVWIRPSADKKSYEYICTHVDDFCIFSRTPQLVMDQITAVYTVKSQGPPEYYLGNDFKRDKKNRWCIGSVKYVQESLRRVESMFGTLAKHDTPMVNGDHPEMDDSLVITGDMHQKYQMLIGILNWIVTLGRLDICFATSSLSRFVACPRQGHLDRALYVFGYLKKRPNRRYIVDSRDPKIVENGAEGLVDKDLSAALRDHYPDSEELLDPATPEPLFDELTITAFVDSDHAHDKLTRRSITGLIIFVGRTPVFYQSKRQGAIETSTYGAEFIAMKTAVEEVVAVRYMLRCLGVNVTHPSRILGDNRSVIINATVHSSLLKKKHVAIAYHLTRETTAARIVHPIKTKSEWNFADILTKALSRKPFAGLVDGIL
eukprot:CAMPEP_0176478512 /NCGR_PEP_ID=MMETSP0200_2-20121128/1227_1 /TAXON_ID=947934 /ORGANISM="Chaetoceros sp., Strain GSL56" /LENGTH=1865 /DNA_ID=CAMNT_0017874457 /DNA_START=317 /DNA_END=5915 /DNA_ORIENTATION=+